MLLGRLFPHDTKIDFVGARLFAFGLTGFLLVATLVSLMTKGLNYGIDFRGGLRIEAVAKAPPIKFDDIRARLNALGVGQVEIQESGKGGTGIVVRVQKPETAVRPADCREPKSVEDCVADRIKAAMGGPAAFDFRQTEVVGPKVSEGLLRDGIIAVVLALLVVAIFVAFRYEWQFGVAALIATGHDVVVAVGLYSLLGLEFDLVAIAALMTLAGYSINDTIVVFDRLRENMRRYKKMAMPEIVNTSVNQMLSRTILTSSTTAIATLPMLFFGGDALFSFTLAIVWGILVGTYSSIYVASSLLLYLPAVRRRDEKADAAAAEAKA